MNQKITELSQGNSYEDVFLCYLSYNRLLSRHEEPISQDDDRTPHDIFSHRTISSQTTQYLLRPHNIVTHRTISSHTTQYFLTPHDIFSLSACYTVPLLEGEVVTAFIFLFSFLTAVMWATIHHWCSMCSFSSRLYYRVCVWRSSVPI